MLYIDSFAINKTNRQIITDEVNGNVAQIGPEKVKAK